MELLELIKNTKDNISFDLESAIIAVADSLGECKTVFDKTYSGKGCEYNSARIEWIGEGDYHSASGVTFPPDVYWSLVYRIVNDGNITIEDAREIFNNHLTVKQNLRA